MDSFPPDTLELSSYSPSSCCERRSRTRKCLSTDDHFREISEPWIWRMASCKCFDMKWDIIASELRFSQEDINIIRARARAHEAAPGVAMLKKWSKNPLGATIHVIYSLLLKYDMSESLKHLQSALKGLM